MATNSVFAHDTAGAGPSNGAGVLRTAGPRRTQTVFSQSSVRTSFSINIRTKTHYTCIRCNAFNSGPQTMHFSRRNSFISLLKCLKCGHAVVQFGATPPVSRAQTFFNDQGNIAATYMSTSDIPIMSSKASIKSARSSRKGNVQDHGAPEELPTKDPTIQADRKLSIPVGNGRMQNTYRVNKSVRIRGMLQRLLRKFGPNSPRSTTGDTAVDDGVRESASSIPVRGQAVNRGDQSMQFDTRSPISHGSLNQPPINPICTCTGYCPCHTNLASISHACYNDGTNVPTAPAHITDFEIDGIPIPTTPWSPARLRQRSESPQSNMSQFFDRLNRFSRDTWDGSVYPSLLSFGDRSRSRVRMLLAPQQPYPTDGGPSTAAHTVPNANQDGSVHDSGMDFSTASRRSASDDGTT